MPSSQQLSLATLVRRSATGKGNLSALMAVVALALVSGHYALILAAGWLFCLLVARDVRSPRFPHRLLARDAEARRCLPEAAEISDQALRQMLASIRAAYSETARVLRHTPEALKAHVRAAIGSLDDIRAYAAQLIRECDELCGYLRTVSRETVEAEIKRLQKSLDEADEAAGREWSEALSIRKEQLAAIDRIRREHDRIVASLERVLGTLEAFPSLIQRLCVLERCAREDLVGDVHVELAGVSGDVTSSRQLLEGLARAPAELETGEGGRG